MPEARSKAADEDVERTRMSIGEHLEELRTCLIRSLLALFAACLLCIWPAKYLLELIARPVIIVLRRHGQPASFLQTSPVEAFLIYVKVVVIFGLLIASPYVIYQVWSFVAKGLYKREKAWVYRLVPVSVGLFFAGVLFMYTLVLMVSLNFLVGFAAWIPLPDADPNALERLLIDYDESAVTATQPATSAPAVALLAEDPPEPAPGQAWINAPEQKLKIRTPDGTLSVQLLRDEQRAMVTTHFKIGEYLSFVMMMTVAFGLAFQMPLVVIFLIRSGIVPAETMRKYRKVVILLIVFTAGMLAPPDLLSHLLLSGPMILLFELGIVIAQRKKAGTASESAD